jgi:hypothetical protein
LLSSELINMRFRGPIESDKLNSLFLALHRDIKTLGDLIAYGNLLIDNLKIEMLQDNAPLNYDVIKTQDTAHTLTGTVSLSSIARQLEA